MGPDAEPEPLSEEEVGGALPGGDSRLTAADWTLLQAQDGQGYEELSSHRPRSEVELSLATHVFHASRTSQSLFWC